MKYTTYFFALALMLAGGSTFADRTARYKHNDAYVYAKVINIEPIYAFAAEAPVPEGIWLAGSCNRAEASCKTPVFGDGTGAAGTEPVEYRVTYSFRGREFQTRLDYKPGRWIRISYSPPTYWRM